MVLGPWSDRATFRPPWPGHSADGNSCCFVRWDAVPERPGTLSPDERGQAHGGRQFLGVCVKLASAMQSMKGFRAKGLGKSHRGARFHTYPPQLSTLTIRL